MMAGIHLDVQLYDNVCIFLKEVWQGEVLEIWLSGSVVVVAQENT